MIIATVIGAVLFLPSIALNIALAFGAPLGMYAMNGRNRVVPKEVRPMLFPFEITRILAFFFAVYLSFYTATVLFSTSHKERTVMGLFAIGATICFWITAFGTLNWN